MKDFLAVDNPLLFKTYTNWSIAYLIGGPSSVKSADDLDLSWIRAADSVIARKRLGQWLIASSL